MLHCSEPTIRRLNICFFLKNSSVFFQWSCASFLQSSFVETFAAELDFFCFLIEAAIGFTAQTNHFRAAKLLFEKSRFALIVLDMYVTTSSWEEVTRRVGGKVVATIVFSKIDSSFFHFRFYTVIQRLLH